MVPSCCLRMAVAVKTLPKHGAKKSKKNSAFCVISKKKTLFCNKIYNTIQIINIVINKTFFHMI